MPKSFYFFSACVSVILLAGCERDAPSPVLVKLDNYGGSSGLNSSYTIDYGRRSSVHERSSSIHHVAAEETLFDIAYRYNIDPINLAKINRIKAPYRLYEGQILKLPLENEKSAAENNVITVEDGDLSWAVKSDEDNMPSYKGDDKLAEKKSKPQKNELDEQFKEIMSLDSDTNSAAAKSGRSSSSLASKGMSFNEQAATLSVPKIIKSSSGTSLKDKNKDKSDEHVTKNKKKISPVPLEQHNEQNKPLPIRRSRIIKPVEEGDVISHFGDAKDGVANDGINIKARLGEKVRAAGNGTVIYVGNKLEEEFGNVVIVQHDDGLISSYAHLKDITVKNNKRVNAGDVVGTVGKSGDVSEPQLHFEIMENKKPIDPEKYLQYGRRRI